MWNKKIWNAIAVGIPVLTILLLLGVIKAIFGIDSSTNVIGSIPLGDFFAVANIIVLYGIWKKHI